MVGRLQPVSPEQTRAVLWRDPLKNVVLLKFLLACRDGATVYQVARAGRVATLLVIDHRASAYDRQTYPATRASAIIASDDPALTREVVTAVSPDDRVIFKLASEEDRQAVGERFALARVTAFHSYTAANHEPTATGCEIGAAADAPFDLFEAQGHDPEWLHGLLRNGRAFTSLVRAGGETRAACFAFEIDGSLWKSAASIRSRLTGAGGSRNRLCGLHSPNCGGWGACLATRCRRTTAHPSASPNRWV